MKKGTGMAELRIFAVFSECEPGCGDGEYLGTIRNAEALLQ
jgi:hypothetical protein